MSTRQRAAATKAKRTSASTDITVTWRGTTYRLPPADEFPLDALEAEEQGKHLTALRLVLRSRAVHDVAQGRPDCA